MSNRLKHETVKRMFFELKERLNAASVLSDRLAKHADALTREDTRNIMEMVRSANCSALALDRFQAGESQPKTGDENAKSNTH